MCLRYLLLIHPFLLRFSLLHPFLLSGFHINLNIQPSLLHPFVTPFSLPHSSQKPQHRTQAKRHPYITLNLVHMSIPHFAKYLNTPAPKYSFQPRYPSKFSIALPGMAVSFRLVATLAFPPLKSGIVYFTLRISTRKKITVCL